MSTDSCFITTNMAGKRAAKEERSLLTKICSSKEMVEQFLSNQIKNEWIKLRTLFKRELYESGYLFFS